MVFSRRDRGDIVNCESGPGKLGGVSMSLYYYVLMQAIHYVPLGPLPQQPSMD